ncbi:30S ribosomal protein S1 [Porphyridium purpureum]|uniref:30S ribosomal protein S1 n=1 Tax=Porphyridium purpureum TaxID=35688 RepID=A0A5J4Z972_PORPP|nr:30S ribosomal protein S1 [Porphyridium purpureum]|eukprot:POR0194..scf295_1
MEGVAFVNGALQGQPLRQAAVLTSRKDAGACALRMVAAPAAAATKFDKMRLKFGVRTPKTQHESGFSYDEFESQMVNYDVKIGMGDLVQGTVVQIDSKGAFVDIGAKASAFLPEEELSIVGAERVEDFIEPGEQREFEVCSTEDVNGQLTVSLKKIEFRRCWERLAQLQAEDITTFATVESVNRGGAMVRVENLRGFIPGSHLGMANNQDIVGTNLPLKFIEVDPEKGRVVLSHRRAIVQSQMTDIETGAVVEGIVRGVKPYGIFVDVNGLTGLIHISQISHDRVDNPENVISVNSKVKCMVISQDKEKGRISLSTKTLEPEPGDMLKSPDAVYDRAEEMAEKYHKRLEEERKAAADVADDIVSSLDIANIDDLPIASGSAVN